MARVRVVNLNRLGADARRQILDALRTPNDQGRLSIQTIEDVSVRVQDIVNTLGS